MLISQSRLLNATLLGVSLLLGSATMVRGGQVEEMSIARMADLAGQVIVGQVAQARSYWAENPRRIETEITFLEIEFAKGAYAGAGQSFSLVVPGGTVEDWTLRVAGAPELAVGERWMLFVLPTYKTHPVVGVFRGAFRIAADSAGIDRVYDVERNAVQRIDARGVIVSGKLGRHEVTLSGQHSSSQAAVRGDEGAKAMTLADFRAAIQPVLDQSRDHQLSGPAGLREAVAFAPVALTVHEQAESPRAPERGASGAVPKQQGDRARGKATKGEGRR